MFTFGDTAEIDKASMLQSSGQPGSALDQSYIYHHVLHGPILYISHYIKLN